MWSGQEQHPVSAAQAQEGEGLLVRAGGTALQKEKGRGPSWESLEILIGSKRLKMERDLRLEERGKKK